MLRQNVGRYGDEITRLAGGLQVCGAERREGLKHPPLQLQFKVACKLVSPDNRDPLRLTEAAGRMATTHPVAAAQPQTFSLALFTVTLFVSAALLFLMEPMFAKMTLPVLGGTSAVWTTCMLFYQAMLLAGYSYANAVTRRVSFRVQAILCVGLALAPLLILPFSIPAGRVPPVEHNPIPWLLMILTFVVGLPFFVLSIVAPTLQKWFAGIGHPLTSDPYF